MSGKKPFDLNGIRKGLAKLDKLADEHPRLLGQSTPEQWEQTLKETLMKKDTYTVDEAAELLSCHEMTVKREITRGNLRAAKVGRDYRISRVELERYWKDRGGGELFGQDDAE